MRAMRTVPEAEFDAWAVVELEDGTTQPATKGELLQRGVKVLSRSDGLVHVMDLRLDQSKDGRRHNDGTLPGDALRVSPIPSKAWDQIEQALPEPARAQVFVADVVRNRDGSRVVDELTDAADVHEAARELVDDPDHPAERKRVRMDEVEEGDLVVAERLPPFRIAGEAKR